MRRPVAAVLGLVLLAGAGAALIAAFERPPDLAFRDRPGVPGFRTLATAGDASAADAVSALLAGVGEPAPSPAEAPDPAALCRALWSAPGLPAEGPAGARPRLAVFSDANCPYCRVLDGVIADLAEDRPGLRIVHHEWPVLGPASVLAARAALAARAQGAFRPVQRRLLRSSFLATPAYLEAVAREQGLDPDRLRADMNGPRVAGTLAATDAAARALGLRGTPALVIGGTVAEGAVSRALIEALLDTESRRSDPPCP